MTQLQLLEPAPPTERPALVAVYWDLFGGVIEGLWVDRDALKGIDTRPSCLRGK